MPCLSEKDGRVRIAIFAKPRAKRSRVCGWRADAVEVMLAAAPADSAANDELVRLFSRLLAIPVRQITLLHGAASKNKVLEVFGVSIDEVRERLAHPDV